MHTFSTRVGIKFAIDCAAQNRTKKIVTNLPDRLDPKFTGIFVSQNCVKKIETKLPDRPDPELADNFATQNCAKKIEKELSNRSDPHFAGICTTPYCERKVGNILLIMGELLNLAKEMAENESFSPSVRACLILHSRLDGEGGSRERANSMYGRALLLGEGGSKRKLCPPTLRPCDWRAPFSPFHS